MSQGYEVKEKYSPDLLDQELELKTRDSHKFGSKTEKRTHNLILRFCIDARHTK